MNNWGNHTQSYVVGNVFVSYATPIAIRTADALVYCKKYSSTSTKQMNRYARYHKLPTKEISVDEFKTMLKKMNYSGTWGWL